VIATKRYWRLEPRLRRRKQSKNKR